MESQNTVRKSATVDASNSDDYITIHDIIVFDLLWSNVNDADVSPGILQQVRQN
jgi:hypothetical protein